jgi:hypothetical protein
LLGVVLVVGGCGSTAATFQPEGACVVDARAAGLYPQLERLLPARLGEAAPAKVDSGRSCSSERLGTLASHGVKDLRYAGATWTPESGESTVIALFRTAAGQPSLEPGWVEEFYESGARASTKTENIVISNPTYDDAGTVYRLDTLNELSYQSVVVWPGQDLVHVVIVATPVRPGGLSREDHDDSVRTAVLTGAHGPSA